MSEYGRSARRIDPWRTMNRGIVLSSVPLRGLCEFEVKLTGYSSNWSGNLIIGIVGFEKRKLISSSDFPSNAIEFDNSCVWSCGTIYKRENGQKGVDHNNSGLVCEGDAVGLQITKEGTLSFYLNGSCKGVAMDGVYDKMSNMEVYAVVDHYGRAVSTEIVRAGE